MFKNSLSSIKKWICSLTAKKIVIISIALFLLLFPLAVALGNVIIHQKDTQSENLIEENLFTVVLFDDQSNEISYESNDPEIADKNSLVAIFYELITSQRNESEITEDLSKNVFVKANTTYNGKNEVITCYFSLSNDEGIFLDNTGKAFTIPKKINKAFLKLPDAEVFYESSIIYNLETADKDTVTPSSVEWYYKNAGGTYDRSVRNAITSSQLNYEMTDTVNLIFKNGEAPNKIKIRISGKSKTKETTNIEDLSNITADFGKDLHIEITAEWIFFEGTDRYGTITYDFFVHIKDGSTFTLDKSEISHGDFAILECTNITDISKIKFESNPSGLPTPIFRQYNDKVIGLVMIPQNQFEHEDFTFTVRYGASSKTFVCSSTPDNESNNNNSETIKIIPARDQIEFSHNEKLFFDENTPRKIVREILKTLNKEYQVQQTNAYFQGNFYSPENTGFKLKEQHNGIVKWGESNQYEFTSVGNRYTSGSNNTLVRAVENGIVTEISENNVLGKYIVIEHGCGLRTWYAGLSFIDVTVGDLILAGESIGKTSQNRFSDECSEYEFYLFCTICYTTNDGKKTTYHNAVIDPNFLFE